MRIFPPSNDKEGWMSFVMRGDSILAVVIRESEELLLEFCHSFIDRYAAKVEELNDAGK